MRAERSVVAFAVAALVTTLAACQTPRPPMQTVPHVDLQRFMGDWYVIANIPTFIERGAHNAVESYRLSSDGLILTDFTFNADAFDGPLKRYRPVGFVQDATNARWGMQFIWPVKADYRIIYLDEGYTRTVIGRERRDHVWIMARTPQISAEDYARYVELIRAQGYDVAKLERVPQQPESERVRRPSR